MSPVRVQRRRTKGWRTPECSCGCGEGARYVGRGSRWGNQWRVSRTPGAVDMWRVTDGRTVVYRLAETRAQQAAAEWFRVGLSPNDIAAMRALRGHDLMCWCPLGSPCHADVLLEMANR